MNMLHRSLRTLLGSAPLFFAASAANASLYTNQVGPNVSYTNINEFDSQLSGPPPVNSNPTGFFGAPALSPAGSDNLSFPTLTFNVQVADGQFELQDGKLTFNVSPTSQNGSINNLNFDEGGAFRVQGPEDDTSVEASLLFNSVSITSVNGTPLATPIVVLPLLNATVTPNVGGSVAFTASTNSDAATADVTIDSVGVSGIGIWDITADFNLQAALAAADLTGNITGVSVALDNQLLGQTTAADSLTLGSIDKKHFIITGTTTNMPSVPEPTSMSILLGAAGLIMRRRRAI